MGLKWGLDSVGILASLNQTGEGSFHPDQKKHSSLLSKQSRQLFLSFWAIVSPPIF